LYTIILTIQVIFIYVNYSLLMIYGDLFSVDMINMIGEAGAAMTSSFIYVSVILQLVGVFLAIVLIGGILLKYCNKDKNNLRYHFSIFNVIIILSFQCFSIGYFVNTRQEINKLASLSEANYMASDTFLMNTSFLKESSYTKFGTYGYFANIIANQMVHNTSIIERATLDYFTKGDIYGTEGNSSPVFSVDNGNNVIVIMMESLEWFGFGDGTYSSELDYLTPAYTPNIYGLIYGDVDKVNDDSLIATSFFAKSKTNMSEGQGIIGNYPVGQSLTEVVRNDTDDRKALGYAMPNVMRDLGYTTTYVHSNEIGFYDRVETHHHLGFDRVIGKDNLTDKEGNRIYSGDELEFDNWDAEGRFVENAIDYIVPKDADKFYTFYLNVSSHGPYEKKYNLHDGDAIKYYYYVKYGEDDCVQNENGDWVLSVAENEATFSDWYLNVKETRPNDSSLWEEMVYYQCGVIGLDDAIGVILGKLDEYGIADETTLLLYSDHYSYYDGLTHRFKGFDEDDFTSIELNTIPLIISSPGLKEINTSSAKYTITDRFCSAYDIVPTLFDLLGIQFNENLYLGHSLFRPADYVYGEGDEKTDMVVYYSNTGGLFSKDVYTFNFSDFVSPTHVDSETIALFKSEASAILQKLNFLSILNRYNLYYKLINI